MTGDEIREARRALGHLWGLGRGLHAAELGRALRLRGKNVGETVLNWERGNPPITGPAIVAIEAMLATGWRPAELEELILRERLP